MARAVGVAGIVIIGLMFLKDGTWGKIVQDAANGVKDFGTGVKPITTIT